MAVSCYGNTALVLSILAVASCVVSFVIPHWLISWEQKLSTFTRIGLWEVCFTAFTDPKMYAYKYYNGCWWIFHPELDDIRGMLNPAWFKAVQAFAVCTLLSSFISFFFLLAGRCREAYRGCGNTAAAAFSTFTVMGSMLSVIVFGACGKDPRLYRLPMPQYNYFGTGFGLMAICCLSAGFCVAFILGDISVTKRRKEEKYHQ